MFLTELFEAKTKTIIVVYPGRFQPFHKGHKEVYNYLCNNYGADKVFICTSSKVEMPRSPFDFQEKLEMMKLTGVNPNKVVQSTQPYRAQEIIANYNPTNTILLFAVSAKDMAEDPRFKFGPKKDGSPSYFQAPPSNLSQAETFDKHAYIITVPTFEFNVLGKPMQSSTEIRNQFVTADENTKKLIIKDLFGTYNDTVYNIMLSKLTKNVI